MSDNKFIAKLKGDPTPNSVVEIKNDKLVAPFKSSSLGYIQDKDSSVVVAKGAQSWIINQNELMPVAEDFSGTEKDIISTSRVEGAGLWVNATYTFPYTGDETNPVSAIIAPNAKWVLTLCGDTLITHSGNTLSLTLLVKIGATHLTTKQFKVSECASQFSKSLCIDFSESEKEVIKAHGGAPLTVQVLCDDEKASATLYNGMSHLSLLQRKIDASLVSTDNVLLPEFIENLSQGFIIPDDYFSRYEFLEKVEDGATAMPEFTRNGDTMSFSGWAKPAEEVYTKTEIDNKFTVANAQIDANATAIVKTRDDMNAEDSRLQTQITAHAGAITALQNEQTATGNQIQTIESKIPDGTSETNPLITKQQLLDEELDIRDDMNEGLSELQTQVTAQAAKIETKQDKLIAGDNIIISGNVITATGAGGGAGFDVIIVQELPAEGEKGIIYLLAKDGTAPDVYDEYVWITATQTFELIGTTQVDLSDYATKEDLENIDALPDQSGNSGKFLTTDGTTASWSNKPLVNRSTNASSIMINLPTENLFGSEQYADCVFVGPGARATNSRNIMLGKNISSTFKDNVCIGWDFSCVGTKSIFITAEVNYTGYWESKYQTAIGYKARTAADYAIQLGSRGEEVANNLDANTFKVANANGNFEMMSADGTIPADRIGNLDFGTMD